MSGRADEARRMLVFLRARSWVARAASAIASRVADARAHAAGAITPGLVARPAGRPTLAGSLESAPLRAALASLDALHDDLSGPGQLATTGLIRDAWADTFLDAWARARSEADPSIVVPWADPPADQVARARSILVDGYSARAIVDRPIADARRRLSAAVPALAVPGVGDIQRAEALRGWRAAAAREIAQAAALAIFTGAYRQDARARRLVIRPDLLHDDPTMEG